MPIDEDGGLWLRPLKVPRTWASVARRSCTRRSLKFCEIQINLVATI